MKKQHNISLYVNNKPGVLIRIALVFARRGYNIDSLVVSQSLKQLNRLVDVIQAKDLTDLPVIKKELALFKVKINEENRSELLQLLHAFDVKPIDICDEAVIFSVDSSGEKIDGIKQILAPFGLIEVIRSGKIIMARGSERT